MSNIYYNKSKERISNIKNLLLKGSYNNLNNKTRNKKISNLDKLMHSLESDLSERSEYRKSKLSIINKTNIGNATISGREIREINRIPKIKKLEYVNNSLNTKSLSKERKNKANDLTFMKSKLISVKKLENIHIVQNHQNKNILKIYKNQCKTQRPLSTISDIKLKKLKFFENKDKNAKYKFININKCNINNNIQKLKHNRNFYSNNIISNDIIITDNNINNLTQRNNFNNNKNILLSLKHKLKEKILNTSRNKIIRRDSNKLTDAILNKSIYIQKSFNNKSKEEEKTSINNNTCDDEDISISKSNFNYSNYNNNTLNNLNCNNKKYVSSLIKPTKKIINKTLPDRDKILDSIHTNKFNYEKYFLSKYKQKTSNTLYKIPLEMRKKIKNKLVNNTICLIKNKKSSNSVDKNNRVSKSINKNENKIKPKNANINNKNIINKIKSNNKKLQFKLISNKESLNQNSLISPTTSMTKENTISIKEAITKKIMKIDSCTLAGYSSPGIQKINQDNFFIINEFLGEEEQFFLGVCDGHGTYGHLVSKYITQILPDYLKEISDESIINSFNLANKSLITNSKIDCSLSGSTCTTLLISLEKIICVNLGDSRAVLAKYENGTYNAFNLSNDHKPNESTEMKRILLNGGRIKPFYDDELQKYVGPERVWLKNSDLPGLAMSRSFGDNVAHSVGVISEPEIIKYEFNGNEKFIILASDGIWEYIDSDECVNIIKDFYENDMDAIGALNALVKEAFNRWKSMDDCIDDITAIVIFFE